MTHAVDICLEVFVGIYPDVGGKFVVRSPFAQSSLSTILRLCTFPYEARKYAQLYGLCLGGVAVYLPGTVKEERTGKFC